MTWRKTWSPTPVFLPGKSHGQRSLEGYSPRGHKESNITEHAHTHTLKYIASSVPLDQISTINIFCYYYCCLFVVSVNWIWKEKKKVTQSCLTLCDPMDYTVHGILQARILEWVVFSFSRGSSEPRDQTQVSCIADTFFTSWATREAQEGAYLHLQGEVLEQFLHPSEMLPSLEDWYGR